MFKAAIGTKGKSTALLDSENAGVYSILTFPDGMEIKSRIGRDKKTREELLTIEVRLKNQDGILLCLTGKTLQMFLDCLHIEDIKETSGALREFEDEQDSAVEGSKDSSGTQSKAIEAIPR